MRSTPPVVDAAASVSSSTRRPRGRRWNSETKRDVNGHRKLQGFGHRKWQGRPAGPRRERSDRSGAAGRQRSRHGRASVAAGDPPSIRFARGWIALESSSCQRMRQLLPRMLTMWHGWSMRSGSSAARTVRQGTKHPPEMFPSVMPLVRNPPFLEPSGAGCVFSVPGLPQYPPRRSGRFRLSQRA